MVETHGNRHKREVDGRTPLSSTVRWCRGGCLENVEACAACPGATGSSFSLGGESHVASSGRFKNGGLGHIVVCVCTHSNGCSKSNAVSAKLDHMLANIAVAYPILTGNICNAVDEIVLLHVDCKRVRQRIAVCTEWSVPEGIGVAIEHV